MWSDLVERRREASLRDIRDKQRRDEEEVAAMTYGPNWREQCPWASPPAPDESKKRLSLVPSREPDEDEDDEPDDAGE